MTLFCLYSVCLSSWPRAESSWPRADFSSSRVLRVVLFLGCRLYATRRTRACACGRRAGCDLRRRPWWWFLAPVVREGHGELLRYRGATRVTTHATDTTHQCGLRSGPAYAVWTDHRDTGVRTHLTRITVPSLAASLFDPRRTNKWPNGIHSFNGRSHKDSRYTSQDGRINQMSSEGNANSERLSHTPPSI